MSLDVIPEAAQVTRRRTIHREWLAPEAHVGVAPPRSASESGLIVGTGIYTLVGESAGIAGPAVILSFIIAGIVCACAALAYAEMSTMMPVAGSAYTYTYAVAGELPAWVVGWSLDSRVHGRVRRRCGRDGPATPSAS